MATQSAFAAAAAAARAASTEKEDLSLWEGCASAARTGVYVGVFFGVVVLAAGAIKAAGSAVGIGGKS